MSNADALRHVGQYEMTDANTMFYHVPEFCGQCGAPMRIKEGWKVDGFDSKSGEPNRYKAVLYCQKERWYRGGYHDKRAMFFRPNDPIWRDKKKKHGLSVLTLITMGI